MVQFNRNRKQENDDYELDEIDEQEEFDDIEESEDDDGSDEPNPWIKRGIIIGAIGLTICGAILIRALTSNETQTPQTEVTTTSETTESPVKVPEESTTTTNANSSTDATVTLKGKDEASAKASLERPEAVLTSDDTKVISEHLTKAFDIFKSNVNGAKNDPASGLYLTSANMMDMLRSVVGLGYAPDYNSVHGYYSDNDNVYQFTVNFTKDGANPLTFTGNYAPNLEQIGLVQIHGELPESGSAVSNTQVNTDKAKQESDTPVNPDAIRD